MASSLSLYGHRRGKCGNSDRFGGFPGGAAVKNPPANRGDARDVGLNTGSGRSPGECNDKPLQYSYQENSMDRGTWGATFHGVTKSWTRLSNWTTTTTVTTDLCLIPKENGHQIHLCLCIMVYFLFCSHSGHCSFRSPVLHTLQRFLSAGGENSFHKLIHKWYKSMLLLLVPSEA